MITEGYFYPNTKTPIQLGDHVMALEDFGQVNKGYRGVVCDLVERKDGEDMSDTVCIGVCWKKHTGGHRCNGTCPIGHGYYLRYQNIQLVSPKKSK